jgi:tRNA pseudouridine32 synthase
MAQLDEAGALAALGVDPSLQAPLPMVEDEIDAGDGTVVVDGVRLCDDCRSPLKADPRPEEMCIFLHALRYEMSLGSFETEEPAWAREDWTWGNPV